MEGVFFCKLRDNIPGLNKTPNRAFLPSTQNCFIQYHFEDFNPPASDLSGVYKSIHSEVWKNIVLSAREPVRNIKPSRIEEYLKKSFVLKTDSPDFLGKSIFFTFENISVTSNFQNVVFDVYAHVSENGILFGKTNVYISYSSEVFGPSVVSNNNISVSKGTIIQNSAYTLTKSDQSSEMLKIEVTSSFSSLSDAYSLTTVPEQFCHIEVAIDDFSALANISFDEFQMTGNSWYFDSSTHGYVPFDRVGVESPIKAAMLDDNVLIHYDFDNVCVTADSGYTFLEFDVMASSNVEWTRLGQADVFIGYSGDAFGPSPSFSYELNPVMEALGYTSFSADYPGFFKEIYMFQPEEDSLQYMKLSTSPKQLAHCKMKIKDCSYRAGLNYSREYMDSLQYYYLGSLFNYGIYNFGEDDFGEFNQYICLDSSPIITKIYPKVLRAGVSDILTIKGKYLKQSNSESGLVYFQNSEHPYNEVYHPAFLTDTLLYTDTLIQIYVPSWLNEPNGGSAASGKIKVTNALGKSAYSDESIEIIYSILNIRDSLDYAYRISHVSADTSTGGYVFYMDDELVGYNPDDCINKALSTWSCLTGINWQLSPTGIFGLERDVLDGKSTLIFGDSTSNTSFLGDTVLAFTTVQGHVKECVNDMALGIWYLDDIDIVFNKNKTFQTDCNVIDTTGTSYDFYSVLIHELSHAHMLGHVFDESSIIFPRYNGVISPAPNDIAAGRDAIAFSLSWDEGGNCSPKHDTISCNTNAINTISINSKIKIFPNPFSNEINIKFEDIPSGRFCISVYTITGIPVFESILYDLKETTMINIFSQEESALPSGIYLLSVKSANEIYTQKIIKQ